ncbi:MAG: hypothetical protein ACKOA8_05630 [Deltaproteobacteria bacterium]
MKITLLTLLFFTATAQAVQPFTNFFDGVRPTGMGNAFIALADDSNTLWYNPAGLADVEGVHFNALNSILGYDSQATLNRIDRAITKSETDKLFPLAMQHMRFNFMPTLIFPNFGISLFSQSQGFFDLSDIVNRGLTAIATHDQGFIVGAGVTPFDFPNFGKVSVGVSVKGFIRSSVTLEQSGQNIIDQVGLDGIQDYVNNLYDTLSKQTSYGYGIGVSLGAKFQTQLRSKRKLKPTLSGAMTIDNLTNLIFTPISEQKVAPTNMRMDVNLGTALSVPISPSWTFNTTADIKNLFGRQGISKNKRVEWIHFGAELKHSIFGIRGGINDGYLSYGFSLEFPPHTRIHFSSYDGEVARTSYEHHLRVYMLQLNIGFNPN